MPGSALRVSIVIPSYNHGRYLEAAIESVLAQDYPAVELIVIDDGSTDDSPGILDKYRGRFQFERQPNQGQAATMSRGWRMSQGDVLAYLSADDVLTPNAVSVSVDALQRNPDAVLVYCDFELIDPNAAVIRRVRAPEFDYREMVTQMTCPPGPGAFFRRSAYLAAGDWAAHYRQYADYEFWLRLGLQGRFQRIPQVLARFRVHPGSQSFASASASAADEPVRVIEAYFSSPLVPPELRAAKQQALSSAYLHTARLQLRAGNYRGGMAAARRAISLYPPHLFAGRTARIAFNGFFNPAAHRMLWTLRSLLRRGG